MWWTPQLPAADPTPSVTRGPYLQLATPTSVVVRWRTDAASTTRVCYGASPTSLSSCIDAGTKTPEHEVTVSGLAPNTTYYYSIGTTTQGLGGGDLNHFFVTSPEPGTPQPTRIWAIGDSGTANANAKAVRDAYLSFTGARGTDVWLMLGDNAYPLGTDSDYQAAVFDIYPALLRQTFLSPALGNHDLYSADSPSQTGPYFDMFTLPANAEAGGVPSGTEAYYSFDYGNIHFIALDSYETNASSTGPMMTWLRDDLQSNTQPWIIAFWHHPPYSKGGHDSDTSNHLKKMREKVLPTLEAGGVDLVLAGHSHSYERSFLIDGHYGTSDTFTAGMKKDGGDGRVDGTGEYQKSALAPVPNEGTVYVVAGSSGKTGHGSLNHPAMFISLNMLGSIVVDVDGNRLDAIFLDSTGATRDHFSIVKNAGQDLPRLTIAASDPTATEAGPTPGSFTVSRTGGTETALTANYTISGTASNGGDYVSLPTTVIIPSGSSTATVTVAPTDDSLVEGNETVIVTLAANAAYTIGAPRSATVTITDNDQVNQPPVVNSGPDQTFTLPASTTVDGTVSDDGLPNPPGALTITWSKVSGPGTVTFGDASSVDTTASFSQSGTYVLRLTANDGALSRSDDTKIVANPAGNPDITLGALSTPSKIGAGTTTSVTDTTKNDGIGSAGASTTRFYLSINKILDAGDIPLGSRDIPALAAGAKNSGAASITVPAGQKSGNYYLLGVADAAGLVVESNEDNNMKYRTVTIY